MYFSICRVVIHMYSMGNIYCGLKVVFVCSDHDPPADHTEGVSESVYPQAGRDEV